MEKFYLEIPSIERKEDALEYLQEHVNYNSNINGSGGLNRCLKRMTYEEWLEDVLKFSDKEYAEENNFVTTTTYFTIRKEDNKIIGMLNLRHYLNDELYKSGGHIGYGIRPTERGKGYAKIQLYLALLESKRIGLDKVMVDCYKTNEASDRTIKSLGGILDREEFEETKNCILNVYWIDVNESIEKYKDEYEKFIAKEKTR